MTIDIPQVQRPSDLKLAAGPALRPPAGHVSTMAGVGTAVPATSFSQEEILDIFAITDPKVRSVFLNSAIQRRYVVFYFN